MAEMNQDLERKAMEALERAKADEAVKEKEEETAAEEPQIPTVDTTRPLVDRTAFETPKQESSKLQLNDDDVIPPPPTEEEMAKVGAATTDDTVILSNSNASTPKITKEDEAVILTGIAKENMPNVPADHQNLFISKLLPEVDEYRKSLILNMGMTPAEAMQAAQNRVRNKAVQENQDYQQAHPEAVVLTIDKSKEEKVDQILDEDTKSKLITSRAIKLMVVENKDLESIQVKPRDKSLNVGHLRDISESLSHYSVPLLAFGDYATFIGAQSGILAAAVAEDDEPALVTLQKKAEMLYRQFRGGTYQPRTKMNDHGELVNHTFEEFCNWYQFDDITMGLYAIVVASSMEETESSINCPSCQRQFNIKYNNKALLDMSKLPDVLKKRVTDIDDARGSIEKMKEIHEQAIASYRFKSPFTQNIYEMCSPSIAEVRKKLSELNNVNETFEIFGHALDLFFYTEKVWLKDTDGEYYLVDALEDPVEMARVLPELHEVDVQLLWNWITQHHDTPKFYVHSKCPYCGRTATDELTADQMLFLQARAFWTEIVQ